MVRQPQTFLSFRKVRPLPGIDERFVSCLESLNRKQLRAVKDIERFKKKIRAEQKEFVKRGRIDSLSGFYLRRRKGYRVPDFELYSLTKILYGRMEAFDQALIDKADSLKKFFVKKRSGCWFNFSLASPSVTMLKLHWRLANEILKRNYVYPLAPPRGRDGPKKGRYTEEHKAVAAAIREISKSLKPIREKSSNRYEQRVKELLSKGGHYTHKLIVWTESKNFPKSPRKILPLIKKDSQDLYVP